MSVKLACAVAVVFAALVGVATVAPASIQTNHPAIIVTGVWLALSVIGATILRVPLRLSSLGVWICHAGVVVLAAGAAIYCIVGVRGQALSYLTQDGWSEINEFQVLDSGALHVMGTGGHDDEFSLELPLSVNPLDSNPRPRKLKESLTRDDLRIEALEFIPRAIIRQEWRNDSPLPMPAAAVSVDDGEFSSQMVLCGFGRSAASWETDHLVVLFYPNAGERTVNQFMTAAPPEELCQGRDMLVLLGTGEVGLSLGIIRADGVRELVPMFEGRAVTVQLVDRDIHLTVEHLYTHAAVYSIAEPSADDNPLGMPAVITRITWGQWVKESAVVFDPLGEYDPSAWLCGHQRTLSLTFGRKKLSLPTAVQIAAARYEASLGGVLPMEYHCDLEIDGKNLVLGLNKPVRVGKYQLTHGHWLDDPQHPRLIILDVASREGLTIIWTGLAMVMIGLFWAFYIKPLFNRRGES